MSARESVWDYPRPPAIETVPERLRVVVQGVSVADTVRGHRVLETSHPPVYYFPPEDVAITKLTPAVRASFCEWKGPARYFDIEIGAGRGPIRCAAWCYPEITPAYAAIEGHVAFYASLVDEAWVGDERVRAQEGDFYGGWITDRVEGPFKGAAGTRHW